MLADRFSSIAQDEMAQSRLPVKKRHLKVSGNTDTIASPNADPKKISANSQQVTNDVHIIKFTNQLENGPCSKHSFEAIKGSSYLNPAPILMDSLSISSSSSTHGSPIDGTSSPSIRSLSPSVPPSSPSGSSVSPSSSSLARDGHFGQFDDNHHIYQLPSTLNRLVGLHHHHHHHNGHHQFHRQQQPQFHHHHDQMSYCHRQPQLSGQILSIPSYGAPSIPSMAAAYNPFSFYFGPTDCNPMIPSGSPSFHHRHAHHHHSTLSANPNGFNAAAATSAATSATVAAASSLINPSSNSLPMRPASTGCGQQQQYNLQNFHHQKPKQRATSINNGISNINNNNSHSTIGFSSPLATPRPKAPFKEDPNQDYIYIPGRGRGKWVCMKCGIRCKKPSMLKKHFRTHINLRPFFCNQCGCAFKTRGNLTKHMKSKSHSKRCQDLGIFIVPTKIDNRSQIDTIALAIQKNIELEMN